MADNLYVFWLLIRGNISKLSEIDFSNVSYDDLGLSFGLGLFVLAVVLLHIVFRFFKKPEHSYKDAGHIQHSWHRQSFFSRLGYFLPKLLFLLAIVLALLVLAKPYFNQFGNTEEVIQSRIRIDLRDSSYSMVEGFVVDLKKTKAELAAENHLAFLKMRRGKNDRVSFWLFASNPHLIQEFTVDDDELYYLQVLDAPWITFSGCSERTPTSIPKERCSPVQGDSGGTAIGYALTAIIKFLDQDEDAAKAKVKSILIVTDAIVDEFPERELKELRNRNVIIYIIFIPGFVYDEESGTEYSSLPDFVLRIGEFGGKYFDIRSQDSLMRAYEEIDRLEKVETRIKKYTLKIDLFQIFLTAVLAIAFLLIIWGLALEWLWPRYP